MRRKPSDKEAKTGPSQRQLRVGEAIRHALARILQDGNLRDPDLIGAVVTVTEVRASPDLKHASAFVLPLGGANVAPIVKALNRAAPFLRGEVAREVQLRHAPQIHFLVDTSFEQASRIDSVLRRPEVRRDVAKEGGDDGEES